MSRYIIESAWYSDGEYERIYEVAFDTEEEAEKVCSELNELYCKAYHTGMKRYHIEEVDVFTEKYIINKREKYRKIGEEFWNIPCADCKKKMKKSEWVFNLHCKSCFNKPSNNHIRLEYDRIMSGRK